MSAALLQVIVLACQLTAPGHGTTTSPWEESERIMKAQQTLQVRCRQKVLHCVSNLRATSGVKTDEVIVSFCLGVE
jgi:tellurite resistance protein